MVQVINQKTRNAAIWIKTLSSTMKKYLEKQENSHL
jgi:hypothetical protein